MRPIDGWLINTGEANNSFDSEDFFQVICVNIFVLLLVLFGLTLAELHRHTLHFISALMRLENCLDVLMFTHLPKQEALLCIT